MHLEKMFQMHPMTPTVFNENISCGHMGEKQFTQILSHG